MNKKIPKNFYNENYKYMKGFTKITVSDICRKLKLSRPVIMQGNGTDEQYILIRKEIEKNIAKLYIK